MDAVLSGGGIPDSVCLMVRRASTDDVDDLCRSLPEVELGTSWGDRLTEVITDAWAAQAPRSLVRRYFEDG